MPKRKGPKRPGPTSVRLSKEAKDALREVVRERKVSQSEAVGQALMWFAEEVGPRLVKQKKGQGAA